MGHYKDEVLNSVAERSNVAQFISFAPGGVPSQRFSRVRRFIPNHRFEELDEGLSCLMQTSASKSINVRSFDPFRSEANEFIYGLTSLADAASAVHRLGNAGLHTIANETIDVNDGGVSGVLLGDVVEFAPEDTPRAVEHPGVASLPRRLGLDILELIYGVGPLERDYQVRTEFSLHPLKTGYRKEHVIVWESQRVDHSPSPPRVAWPNRFSRYIGDKAYGLLVASLSGLLVPESLVIPRHVVPFRFGVTTGTGEVWTRTCPPEPVPGHFTTARGYVDPFALLAEEDPEGEAIASVLVQAGVAALYAGAAATQSDGTLFSEGVRGTGEDFMQGSAAPQPLPEAIVRQLQNIHTDMASRFGPVRFEWAFDGDRLWVLQLHVGSDLQSGRAIYPGSPLIEHRFDVREGLEALRSLVARLEGTGEGVVVLGDVGITSHFGDVLRRAAVPSRIEPLSQTS